MWGWESPSLRKWFNPFMTCRLLASLSCSPSNHSWNYVSLTERCPRWASRSNLWDIFFSFIAKLQFVTSLVVAVGRERVDVCEEVVKRRKSSVQSVALQIRKPQSFSCHSFMDPREMSLRRWVSPAGIQTYAEESCIVQILCVDVLNCWH